MKGCPCKNCLKYVMCNSKLRKELSVYHNPYSFNSILVVGVNYLLYKCKDLSDYMDDKIVHDPKYTKRKVQDIDKEIDERLATLLMKIFNFNNLPDRDSVNQEDI